MGPAEPKPPFLNCFWRFCHFHSHSFDRDRPALDFGMRGLDGRAGATEVRSDPDPPLFRPTVPAADMPAHPMRPALRARRTIVHARSEENTSELQSLMRIPYAVFCLKKKTYRYDVINN